MNNKKLEFKNSKGEDVVVYVKKPNAKDWRDAKTYSVKVAAEFFKTKTSSGDAAFLVRANMKKHLEDAGLWSSEDEDELRTLNKKAKELEDKLSAGGMKKSLGRQIAIELAELRDKQIQLMLKLQEFDNLTVEYHTENAELDYLCSCCILSEEGDKLFEDADDFVERLNDEEYYMLAKEELKKVIFGDVSIQDVLKERPEYKFLFHFKYLNQDFELVNEEGKKVDKEGNIIDQTPTVSAEIDFSKFDD